MRKTCSFLWLTILLGGASPDLPGAPMWLDTLGEYSLYVHDFNGDGRADVAELLEGRLNLYFTPTDHIQVAGPPDVSIALPDGMSILSPAQLTTATTRTDWIALGTERIWILDLSGDQAAFRALETSGTMRLPHTFSAPRLSQIAIDLNGDGVDEILTPGRDDLQVWTITPDGALTLRSSIPWDDQSRRSFDTGRTPNVLSPSYADQPFVNLVQRPSVWTPDQWRFHEIRHYGEATPTRHFIDLNRNGRLDLAREHGGVLLQQPDMSFVPQEGEQGRYAALEGFTFLADFDGDGIQDGLIIKGSRDLANPATRIELYRGREGRPFSYTPDAEMLTEDYTYLPDRVPIVDFNNNGHPDLMLTKVNLSPAGVQSNLEAFFKGGLNLQLRVYLWNPQGGPDGKGFFESRPAWTHPIRLAFEIFGLMTEQDSPIITEYDLTGDDLPDLITKVTENTIGLFPQQGGARGFAPHPTRTATLNHPVQALYARDVDGQPPIEVLCISPPDAEGHRQASVIHWN